MNTTLFYSLESSVPATREKVTFLVAPVWRILSSISMLCWLFLGTVVYIRFGLVPAIPLLGCALLSMAVLCLLVMLKSAMDKNCPRCYGNG